MYSRFPEGTSWRCQIYYGQCVDNGGNFRKYDYGAEKNMELYGQTTPPEIPVEDIQVPVGIVRGTRDTMCAEDDIDTLI